MHEFEYHFGNISTKLILMPKTKSTEHPPTCSTNIADRKFSLTAYHHECTGAKCKIIFQKWEVMMANQSLSWSNIQASWLDIGVNCQSLESAIDCADQIQGWDRKPQTGSITYNQFTHAHLYFKLQSHSQLGWKLHTKQKKSKVKY